MKGKRRDFVIQAGLITAGISSLGLVGCFDNQKRKEGSSINTQESKPMSNDLFFKISLAEWSLNKSIFSGELDHLDFAAKSKNEFGLDAVEYSSQFFQDKATDISYIQEMKKRADDNGVKSLLIMIDNEGDLGSVNNAERKTAIENHYKWVDAAKILDCHSIRVNAFGEGSSEDVSDAVIDGLGRLSEYGAKLGINVIVENHGSYSSDGAWLANVMEKVGMENCGTLPDFGFSL